MSNWNIPNIKVDTSRFRPYKEHDDSYRNSIPTIKYIDNVQDKALNELREKFKSQEEKIEDKFKVLDDFIDNYYKDYVLIHRKLQEAIDLLEKIKNYKV